MEFDSLSYRYEPGFDMRMVTWNTTPYWGGDGILNDEPFSHFRMWIPDSTLPRGPLLEGDLLVDADTRPADSIYWTVNDLNGDYVLSAHEYVMQINDSLWRNDSSAIADNDFVAQTPIASSWGLMQNLYPTAQQYGWSRHPHLLFDPLTSITYGAIKLSQSFQDTDTTLTWNDRWRDALLLYNGGMNQNYDDEVFERIQEYQPHLN